MPQKRVLITGVTGMVGRYIARRMIDAGYDVRGLFRRRSAADSLDIEWVEGDLAQPETLSTVLSGMDVVVHAAAQVGDWGPVEQYRRVNVYALEHLLSAAQAQGRLNRWIQISSLGIYPAGHHYGTTEAIPADSSGLDGYTKSKAEAETVLRRHMEQFGLPAVILRPGFVYGRGDRHVVPRIIAQIDAGRMRLIGDGEKLLNNTFAGNLADAVLLAIETDRALGETFNIRDERLVTRREFIGAIADHLGKPYPRHVPERLARLAVGPIEWLARFRGAKQAPLLTRARLKFLTSNLDFSIAKAKAILGYAPAVDFRDGIKEALQGAPAKPRIFARS